MPRKIVARCGTAAANATCFRLLPSRRPCRKIRSSRARPRRIVPTRSSIARPSLTRNQKLLRRPRFFGGFDEAEERHWHGGGALMRSAYRVRACVSIGLSRGRNPTHLPDSFRVFALRLLVFTFRFCAASLAGPSLRSHFVLRAGSSRRIARSRIQSDPGARRSSSRVSRACARFSASSRSS